MLAACLLLLAGAAAAAACNATGTYVDRAGNIASLLVAADGSIAARSFSATRWQRAAGRVINATSLWLAFHPLDNETGTLVSNCSTLVLPGAAPSVWGKVGDYLYGADASPPVRVTDVHLVFMNHVDMGYTDLARNVCDRYFSDIIPANIALAQQLAASATPFALTSQSFFFSSQRCWTARRGARTRARRPRRWRRWRLPFAPATCAGTRSR